MVALEWINKLNLGENQNNNLIREARDLIRRRWEVDLKHVYREGNRAFDFLSELSLELPTKGLRVWRDLPRGMETYCRKTGQASLG